MDFFVRLFLIAVVKGVDDAFADGHADAVAIVFAETGGLGHAPLAIFEGNAPQKPQLSVTQRIHPSQWRERCSAAAEFPEEQEVASVGPLKERATRLRLAPGRCFCLVLCRQPEPLI